MATLEECRAALTLLAERISAGGGAADFDRTLSARVTDLGTTSSGRLSGGTVLDVTTDERPRAQIRLTLSSDDLVALTRGELSVAPAWASGRIKIDAGFRDLLRLRSMF